MQMKQFGFRNDAWIAVDEARAEVAYLLSEGSSDTSDLSKALVSADKAFADYLALANSDTLAEARTKALNTK